MTRAYPKTSERVLEIRTTNAVIPAKVGIHLEFVRMKDERIQAKPSCFRKYDKHGIGGFGIGSKRTGDVVPVTIVVTGRKATFSLLECFSHRGVRIRRIALQ